MDDTNILIDKKTMEKDSLFLLNITVTFSTQTPPPASVPSHCQAG